MGSQSARPQPNLIEQLEARQGAMRVHDVAAFLGEVIDEKSIYRMAARGQMPSFRLGGAICFDPQELAKWLRDRYTISLPPGKKRPASYRPANAASSMTG